MVTRLRASPRHGGATCFSVIFLLLIVIDPLLGRPRQRAAEFIAFGGMGVWNPPIIVYRNC